MAGVYSNNPQYDIVCRRLTRVLYTAASSEIYEVRNTDRPKYVLFIIENEQ